MSVEPEPRVEWLRGRSPEERLLGFRRLAFAGTPDDWRDHVTNGP